LYPRPRPSRTSRTFLPTNSATITDAVGALTNYVMYPPLAASPTQRPIPFYNLGQIYTPDKPAAPNIEYDYDSVGHVSDVLDAEALQVGDRAPYEFYIANGTRGERDDPLGDAWSVVYDTYGHPAQYTDELGNVTLASADGRGRVVQYTYPEGDQELFQYDDHGNTTSYTKTPKPAYCTPTCPANLVATALWDQTWNKPLTVTNAGGNTTTLTYYAFGNGESLLHTATRPAVGGNAPVYTFTYDSAGKVLTSTDPIGIVTQSTYDGSENLASTILDSTHLALTTSYAYDSVGNTTTVTDPRGNATTSIFDPDRRKTEDDRHNGNSLAALLAASKTTYDLLGRDVEDDAGTVFSGTSVTSWLMVKQTAYTPTSKVASVTDGDTRVTTTTYDGVDRPSIVTDPVLRQSQTIYDAAGNTLQEIHGLGTGKQATYATYTYGSDGEKLSVYDADGPTHVTDYSYDAFNRLSSTIYPDLTHEDASYDADGNILTRVNRAGQTLTYTYDALDRMATKVMPLIAGVNPQVTTSWTYLLNDLLSTLTDSNGDALGYLYDTAGRPASATTTIPGISSPLTTSYQLDANGNRTRLTWPDGYYVTYTYDALDRMWTALENGTFTLATYGYDTLSRRTSLAYRSVMSSSYTYTNAGDLTALNLTTTTGTVPNYTLGYTHAHELNSEATSQPSYVWQPAATGRDNYTAVNALNQYPSWTPSGGTKQNFTYDGNGNMTTAPIGGSTWAFAYDPENRLITANQTSGGTVAATYAYDTLGRRNEKSGTGVTTTYFLDDGTDEIAEYNSAGTPTERYVPGPTVNDPIIKTVVSSGARYFFQADHHGSVIATGNSVGNEIEGPFTYDSYGNCFVGTAACSTVNSTPYKFVGMRLDPETGLYYDRARYYSSVLGRFPQPDSVGYTADLNIYSYAKNNPTNSVDPMGTEAVSELQRIDPNFGGNPQNPDPPMDIMGNTVGAISYAGLLAAPESVITGMLIGGAVAGVDSARKGNSPAQIASDAGKGAVTSTATGAGGALAGKLGAVPEVAGEAAMAYAGTEATGGDKFDASVAAGSAAIVGGGAKLLGLGNSTSDKAAGGAATFGRKVISPILRKMLGAGLRDTAHAAKPKTCQPGAKAC
jgi:RHS repeat-associated protein